MSEKIVQLNEDIIKGQLKELVRGSVEETLNELLEQEAEKLTQAARYERSEARQGYRSGHYDRNLTTTCRLRAVTFRQHCRKVRANLLTTLSGGVVLTAIGFDKIVRPDFYGLLARLPEVHCAENRVWQYCQTRFFENTASGNIAKSGKGVKNTSKQSHRTCVRMSTKDYDLLKKKSAAAGLSANAWLMAQLAANRPVLHREEENWDTIHFMDAAGREINAIARNFNSGYGTAEQLQHAVRLLGDVYERVHTLRKKGYLHAA